MPHAEDRTVRVFISSTFGDFDEERDLLARRVFPSLQSQLKDRFVEVVEVDFRWGITAEQAERGEVLPIILSELDRSTYFVGLLGERYGAVPSADAYTVELLEQQPWLNEHAGGKSLTEFEVLHGVINNPKMTGRALFYFRSKNYARKKGGVYLPPTPENAAKQADLKDRIRKSGFPIIEDYATPKSLAERLEADLWSILDATFPVDEVPDLLERESRRHQAYAAPKLRLYNGGKNYLDALDNAISKGAKRVLIVGAPGSGKSALIVNWVEHYSKAHPDHIVHSHYVGASADAADPSMLGRRLIESIERIVRSGETVPNAPERILEIIPTWLAYASEYAEQKGVRWVIAIDALNALTGPRGSWLPPYLPDHVCLIVSCPPEEILLQEVFDSAKDWEDDPFSSWEPIQIEPLEEIERKNLFLAYLARYSKRLPSDLFEAALSHPLASSPLFLKTLAEEMRFIGVHERLREQLDYYLESETVDDLFERVLARIEQDCGAKVVRSAMESIWASRSGLTEQEILGITRLVQATWAPIRLALGEALIEINGRLSFAHDHLRIAVSDRYLDGNNELSDDKQTSEGRACRREAHMRLGSWFEGKPLDIRVVEDLPYQWLKAGAWKKLQEALTTRELCELLNNEELLGYWLRLEHEADVDIEREYELIWQKWIEDLQPRCAASLAMRLFTFLHFCGKVGAFGESLVRFALDTHSGSSEVDELAKAQCMNDLGSVLQDRGQSAPAEELYRQALSIRERILDPNHPSIAESLNNIACVLDEKDALPLLERAVAISEQSLGVGHSTTASYLCNLASTLDMLGHNTEAEKMFERALNESERRFGRESLAASEALGYLGVFFWRHGSAETAELIIRRALHIEEIKLGRDHPRVATTLGSLAECLRRMGNYGTAEMLCRRALSITEKALGKEHPETTYSRRKLADLLKEKRQTLAK